MAASAAIEQQLVIHPAELRAHMFLATLYNRLAAAGNPGFIDKAKAHTDRALEISPTRQGIYFMLADNFILRGDLKSAAATLEKAVALAPSFITAQTHLARIGIKMGDANIPAKAYEDILANTPEEFHSATYAASVMQVADEFVDVKNIRAAIVWAELAVRINPERAQYRANLAGLYARIGDKEKAKEHALAAAELDPEGFSKQIEEFLKQL